MGNHESDILSVAVFSTFTICVLLFVSLPENLPSWITAVVFGVIICAAAVILYFIFSGKAAKIKDIINQKINRMRKINVFILRLSVGIILITPAVLSHFLWIRVSGDSLITSHFIKEAFKTIAFGIILSLIKYLFPHRSAGWTRLNIACIIVSCIFSCFFFWQYGIMLDYVCNFVNEYSAVIEFYEWFRLYYFGSITFSLSVWGYHFSSPFMKVFSDLPAADNIMDTSKKY
jgi:hypothetical protein